MPSEYEREIEEILRRMGDLTPRRTRMQRLGDAVARQTQGFRRWLGSVARGVPADQLMLLAIVCVVSSLLLRFIPLMRWVGLAGVLLFLLAFALSFRQVWGRRSPQKRWRGRIIDINDGRPTLADRLIVWFRRQFGAR